MEMITNNEELENLLKNIPERTSIEIEYVRPTIFSDDEIRKESIKNLIEVLEDERKKWVEGSCSLNKEYLKGKNFREKTLALTSMPLDRYFINRYFNLLESFFQEVIKICNLNLNQEKFESILNKLKKESKELQWLDKHFKDYCRLEFSYYQKIIELFNKKFLFRREYSSFKTGMKAAERTCPEGDTPPLQGWGSSYCGDDQKINEIVKKIKEVI